MAHVHPSQNHHRLIATPVLLPHQSRSLPCKSDPYRLYSHRYPRTIFPGLHLHHPSRRFLSVPPRSHPRRLGLAHALPRFRQAPAMWDLERRRLTIAPTPLSCHNCGIRSIARERYGNRRLVIWRRKCGRSRRRLMNSRWRRVLLVDMWDVHLFRMER